LSPMRTCAAPRHVSAAAVRATLVGQVAVKRSVWRFAPWGHSATTLRICGSKP
jgi:hypothetical protein